MNRVKKSPVAPFGRGMYDGDARVAKANAERAAANERMRLVYEQAMNATMMKDSFDSNLLQRLTKALEDK